MLLSREKEDQEAANIARRRGNTKIKVEATTSHSDTLTT